MTIMLDTGLFSCLVLSVQVLRLPSTTEYNLICPTQSIAIAQHL